MLDACKSPGILSDGKLFDDDATSRWLKIYVQFAEDW